MKHITKLTTKIVACSAVVIAVSACGNKKPAESNGTKWGPGGERIQANSGGEAAGTGDSQVSDGQAAFLVDSYSRALTSLSPKVVPNEVASAMVLRSKKIMASQSTAFRLGAEVGFNPVKVGEAAVKEAILAAGKEYEVPATRLAIAAWIATVEGVKNSIPMDKAGSASDIVNALDVSGDDMKRQGVIAAAFSDGDLVFVPKNQSGQASPSVGALKIQEMQQVAAGRIAGNPQQVASLKEIAGMAHPGMKEGEQPGSSKFGATVAAHAHTVGQGEQGNNDGDQGPHPVTGQNLPSVTK